MPRANQPSVATPSKKSLRPLTCCPALPACRLVRNELSPREFFQQRVGLNYGPPAPCLRRTQTQLHLCRSKRSNGDLGQLGLIPANSEPEIVTRRSEWEESTKL